MWRSHTKPFPLQRFEGLGECAKNYAASSGSEVIINSCLIPLVTLTPKRYITGSIQRFKDRITGDTHSHSTGIWSNLSRGLDENGATELTSLIIRGSDPVVLVSFFCFGLSCLCVRHRINTIREALERIRRVRSWKHSW